MLRRHQTLRTPFFSFSHNFFRSHPLSCDMCARAKGEFCLRRVQKPPKIPKFAPENVTFHQDDESDY